MRPIQVISALILMVISFCLILSFLGGNEDEGELSSGPIPGSLKLPDNGIIYDLKAAGINLEESEDNFIVQGFTFYRKLPKAVRKITRTFTPRNAWLLMGKGTVGNITLRNVQREQSKRVPVLVLVSYFANWNYGTSSSISVIGRTINPKKNEIEEETEELPDLGGELPPIKSSYCQKLVYFGVVDEASLVTADILVKD